MCGIGKGKAISVAKKMQLTSVSQLGASLGEAVMGRRILTVKLYGMNDNSSSQNWYLLL